MCQLVDLWILFLLLALYLLITLLNFDVIVFYLTLFYFVIFYNYLLESCSFLMSHRKGVDQDGRELGMNREE